MPPTRIQSTDSSTSSPYPQYSYPYPFPKSAHNSALTTTPTFLKSGPVAAYHTPATPSVFTAPPYASLNLKKRTQIHRRLGISVTKDDAMFDTTDMSRQSSLSSAKTLHERISVLSFDEESKSVKGVVKGSETGGVFEVVGSKTAISITPQDIVLFLDAIKELVVIPDGGVLSIPDDQMGTIRSSVFSFYDLVFDSTDSNSTNASEYCLTQTPHLLLTLKYITNPPPAPPIPTPSLTLTPTNFIQKALFRATTLLNIPLPTPQKTHEILKHTDYYLIRNRIVTLLTHILASRPHRAVQEFHALVERVSQMTTAVTCVQDESTTYLVYTGVNDAFQVVSGAGAGSGGVGQTLASVLRARRRGGVQGEGVSKVGEIRSAIARIPVGALCPGDMVVVLSGGSVVGETSFLPAPPGMRDVGGGGGGRGGKVSEKVCLARLVGVEGVYPGFCRLTVCVVKEKLGFSACCAAGESGVELDNRVKDAVKYGAVRVDDEIVGLLFGA